MRVSSPASTLVAQTNPSPTASPYGCPSTSTVASTVRDDASDLRDHAAVGARHPEASTAGLAGSVERLRGGLLSV
jgi:hypothetical protein